MSKKEFEPTSGRIAEVRFRLGVFRPTYKKFSIWSWLHTIARKSEAVFFREHRPRVHEFL